MKIPSPSEKAPLIYKGFHIFFLLNAHLANDWMKCSLPETPRSGKFLNTEYFLLSPHHFHIIHNLCMDLKKTGLNGQNHIHPLAKCMAGCFDSPKAQSCLLVPLSCHHANHLSVKHSPDIQAPTMETW